MNRAAYGRVSTTDQNLERQIKAIRDYAKDTVSPEYWFLDKASGKDFERAEYQRMKEACQRGEISEIVVKELDRLGRNKDEVKDELRWFKDNGIVVRILDIPTTLVEMPSGGTSDNTWVIDMITNVIIEVYASIAEQERTKILTRQAEGIAEAKKRGVYTTHHKGRTRAQVDPAAFEEAYQGYTSKYMSIDDAAAHIGLSVPQTRRRFKERSSAGEGYNPNAAQ